MRNRREKREGFALITVLIFLLVVSILVVSILGVTSSTFKMTKIDSKNQATFYIAEAGINYMIDEINLEVTKNEANYKTNTEFFQNLEKKIIKNEFILDDFESNNREEPKAFINVSQIKKEKNSRDYKIESSGMMGGSKRTVNSIINITYKNTRKIGNLDDIFIYGSQLKFTGSAIKGEGSTIVSGGLITHNLNGGTLLDITNMYFGGPVIMDGGSASFGSKNKPGNIYIDGNLEFLNGTRNVYGDIHINGDVKLKDVVLHGDMYVDGDIKFIENGPTPNGKIYYTGNIDSPPYYSNTSYQKKILSKCVKVDKINSFKIPKFTIEMKDESWYIQNGYTIGGNESQNVIPDNAKLLVNNFYSKHHTSPKDNVIIISKNNIDISGWRDISGVLIAPEGEVKLDIGSFTGVIISKEGITASGGGWNINNRELSDFFTDDTMPINIYDSNESDNEDLDILENIEIKVNVIKPIKEN